MLRPAVGGGSPASRASLSREAIQHVTDRQPGVCYTLKDFTGHCWLWVGGQGENSAVRGSLKTE